MLLQKYTPDWIMQFTFIKQEIETALLGVAYTIEHVGSTAVPNLDAKPIIDIDVVYEDPSNFGKLKNGLVNLGYYHNGNQGIPDREVFKRNGKSFNKVLDTITHHLYVCLDGSSGLERHILSRNFLRKMNGLEFNTSK
jgi:GrpB-like predicted nucleotidyltransferase (UPF0157 family)